jgi:hypothetical protein
VLFNAHLCNHILRQSGGGTWGTGLLLEVWVLGVWMSTLESSCFSWCPETKMTYGQRPLDLRLRKNVQQGKIMVSGDKDDLRSAST